MGRPSLQVGHDTFGGRLATVRVQHGLTQATLGNLVGRSQVTVAHWENGRREPPLEALRVLRNDLNIDLNWLIAGEGNEWQALIDLADEATADIAASISHEGIQRGDD